MEETEQYSGFFCKKCNFIPLIQIIPKKNNIKIFSSCKCCKQYEDIDTFIKNKYQKIINKNKIQNKPILYSYNNSLNKEIEKDIDVNNIIENFIQSKEIMNKNGIKIKNELVEIYKRKIEKINKLYENYINNNNKIIIIIEQIIKSYKMIKDNPSNKLNILNNCIFNKKSPNIFTCNNTNFNLDSLFKQVENYYRNEFIISSSSIKEGLERNYFSFNYYSVNNFIELDNNLCALCLNNLPNLFLYNLNNFLKEKYSFNAHSNLVNWIIKSNKNNIISCGNDGLIKIWPSINEEFLNDEKNVNIFIDKNNLKQYNIKNLKKINLNPLYEYKYENE